MVYVVMGVCGCGKTTIGQLLAECLSIPFYDADSFHPAENVAKMSQGIPLDDDDRRPWLESLAQHIRAWNHQGGAVLACSALRERYRDLLTSRGEEAVTYVYLKGSRDMIAERMRRRTGHYMPEKLLDSQFETLEEPKDAVVVDIEQPPESICRQVLAELEARRA